MRTSLLALCLIVFSSNTSSFEITQTAEEFFNQKTGELYWDIDSTFRVKIQHNCFLTPYAYYGNNIPTNKFDNFIQKIDLFSVLGSRETYTGINCQNPALKIINKLRQNGAFLDPVHDKTPSLFIGNLSLNKSWGHEENYEPIYAALKLNKQNVIIRLSDGNSYGYLDNENLKSFSLSIKNIENSFKILKQTLIKEGNDLNEKTREKYWLVIVIDLISLIGLFIAMYLLKIKIIPIFLKVLNSAFCYLKDTVGYLLSLLSKSSVLIKKHRIHKIKAAATDEAVREAVRQNMTINSPNDSDKDTAKKIKQQIKEAIANGDDDKADILIELLRTKNR